jgi:alpha-D-ribose 1-methylphosphonate 5-triphosphate synthase subunit PhnG
MKPTCTLVKLSPLKNLSIQLEGITKMFHAFDNVEPAPPMARADWMALLARAPLDLLESAVASHWPARPNWLRAPETGLMMVQGRAGSTGERFNLGEVTVSRCALRLKLARADAAVVGVAYALGRSHRQVGLAAVADALLQDPANQDLLEQTLLTPVRLHLAQQRSQREQAAQSTKVEFFTVAREAGSPEEDGEEA